MKALDDLLLWNRVNKKLLELYRRAKQGIWIEKDIDVLVEFRKFFLLVEIEIKKGKESEENKLEKLQGVRAFDSILLKLMEKHKAKVYDEEYIWAMALWNKVSKEEAQEYVKGF